MRSNPTIRAERDGDQAAIADVVRRAYSAVPHSDHREHLMVSRLRDSTAFVPPLSLVAETAGVALGHVLLVSVTGPSRAPPRLLVLAPLSIVPEHQNKGVGTALIEAAHARAARLGFAAIILIGRPDYYGRFGYRPLAETRLTLPFAVKEEQRLVHVIVPEVIGGCEGVVTFPPAWMAH